MIPIHDLSDDPLDQVPESRTPSRCAHILMCALWPAFLVAGVAEIVFFSVVDPGDLQVFGQPVELSRTGVYTIGFFGFWVVGAASAAITAWLVKTGPG